MKQIIILTAAVLLFASCEKRRCYQCQAKYKPQSFNSQEPWKVTAVTEHCGWTEEDMDNYIKSGTYTTPSTFGAIKPAVRITYCW